MVQAASPEKQPRRCPSRTERPVPPAPRERDGYGPRVTCIARGCSLPAPGTERIPPASPPAAAGVPPCRAALLCRCRRSLAPPRSPGAPRPAGGQRRAGPGRASSGFPPPRPRPRTHKERWRPAGSARRSGGTAASGPSAYGSLPHTCPPFGLCHCGSPGVGSLTRRAQPGSQVWTGKEESLRGAGEGGGVQAKGNGAWGPSAL